MLVAAFSLVAGYLIAGGRDFGQLLLPALLTALVTGAGNIINDYFDLEIDRVNKPRRPLPSGRIGAGSALIGYAIVNALLAVAILVALAFPDRIALTVPMTAVLVIWSLALFVYARWVKRWLITGNLLVSAVSASSFLAGGIVVGRFSPVWLPFAVAFVFVLSRELVKGGEDLSGDRAAGVKTVAVAWGTDKAAATAAVIMLLLAVALPLPTVVGYYGNLYFWIMTGLVVPGLIFGAAQIVRRPERASFTRVSALLKLEMFCGVLAIALGKLA